MIIERKILIIFKKIYLYLNPILNNLNIQSFYKDLLYHLSYQDHLSLRDQSYIFR